MEGRSLHRETRRFEWRPFVATRLLINGQDKEWMMKRVGIVAENEGGGRQDAYSLSHAFIFKVTDRHTRLPTPAHYIPPSLWIISSWRSGTLEGYCSLSAINSKYYFSPVFKDRWRPDRGAVMWRLESQMETGVSLVQGQKSAKVKEEEEWGKAEGWGWRFESWQQVRNDFRGEALQTTGGARGRRRRGNVGMRGRSWGGESKGER